MSGTPAYTFEVKRDGRKPIEVVVNEDGQRSIYLFGCWVTNRQIDKLLPMMVEDRKSRNRRRGVK